MNKKITRAKKIKKARNMCKNNGFSHSLHSEKKPKRPEPKLSESFKLNLPKLGGTK